MNSSNMHVVLNAVRLWRGRQRLWQVGGLAVFALLVARTVAADDSSPKTPSAPSSSLSPAIAAPAAREKLEEALQKQLSGAVLAGRYTSGKFGPDQSQDSAKLPLSEDRYTISKVTKIKDDYWLFFARIQYRGHNLEVPVPLRILWAGDTPVITLDQSPVPGLGTFSARVLIQGNQYAGTWSGGDHGGHLFGKIERQSGGTEAKK